MRVLFKRPMPEGLMQVLDVPVRDHADQPTVCRICAGGKIICAHHPTSPLAHDGCESPGMPCPRCAMKNKA